MSVVKRCPSCGTTQAAAGECEACHEAQVGYFCTNHEPGVWLAGRTCPQCAARAALPVRPVASTSARPVASTSARASRARPTALRPGSDRPGDARRLPMDEAALDLRASPAPWEDLLRGAVVARAAPPPAGAAPEREPGSRNPAGGWLARLALRLVLIALFLVVAFGVAVYWIARSLP